MGLVNAGDGSGQHPSQSMLDMMTIYNEFGHFDGLKIMIVGDLTNSRVARSNMEILNTLGAEVYFSGPEYWYDEAEFSKYGTYVKNIDDMIPNLDVLMLLRVQHERHNGAEAKTEELFDAHTYNEAYGLNQRRYDMLKDDAIIMHPGPINRGVEWDGELVEAPKSRYAVQMENGVFVRMAMIEAVLRGRKLAGLE
jgi:aspartate carbamoyltransferase catalytic subunit